MKTILIIRQVSTGKIRFYEYDWEEMADLCSLINYMFADGNYSCDCNRGLFFARALGEDDPDNLCGEEQYDIRVVDHTGKEIYKDDNF